MAEGLAEMTFARSAGADDEYRGALGEVAAGGKLVHERAVELRQSFEIELLEGLGGTERGAAQAHLELLLLAAGVILRELITFADQGADVFFGLPEFDTADLLRVGADGRGIVSMLELPAVQDRPQLFSTFLMWLLADLFHDLPEVGDLDKPKLVFFFDEAHLLFADASKDFLQAITQTVRLIRSKGVGVFFVTQSPKDVPGDVLAQLGNRVQHALRAYTPDDAKALKAAVSTYPKSAYDLEELLTQLGTGEAVITVLSERGAPTPVAWTRMRAPQSLDLDPTGYEGSGRQHANAKRNRIIALVVVLAMVLMLIVALRRKPATELLVEREVR